MVNNSFAIDISKKIVISNKDIVGQAITKTVIFYYRIISLLTSGKRNFTLLLYMQDFSGVIL